jgi:hypothetical protein
MRNNGTKKPEKHMQRPGKREKRSLLGSSEREAQGARSEPGRISVGIGFLSFSRLL